MAQGYNTGKQANEKATFIHMQSINQSAVGTTYICAYHHDGLDLTV